MNVSVSERAAEFSEGGRLLGRYVLDDSFKPHFSVLNSPTGHNVTMVSPADHRHHKGLMYALRCPDLNFWEEEPGGGACGVQLVRSTERIENGIRQALLWREEGGGLETYRENRSIMAHLAADGKACAWTWRSQREALRDHRLCKSEWSLEVPDGRRINYHGLGIRLPWAWAFHNDRFNGLEVDGQALAPMDACGTNGPALTWWGWMDGYWTPPVCAVTLRQHQQDTWFALKGDFAYLAIGPSNLEEREVKAGDTFDETYTIVVEDRT